MPTANAAISVMGALFAIIGIGAWVFVAALSHRIDVQKVLQGAELLAIVAACFGGIAAVTVAVLNWLSKRRPAFEKPKKWILGGVLVTSLVGAFFIIETSKLPLEPTNWFFYPIYFLIAGISVILSRKTRADVTTATAPSNVAHWYDFYASADPVPNGPTRILEPEPDVSRFQSIRISNLGSFFADHMAYWDNLDGFVLPVIRTCAETAASPWKKELPREFPETNLRSEWRVGWLQLAKWAVYISSTVAGIALWVFHRDGLPIPFKLPLWLPAVAPTGVRLAMFVAGIVIIVWFVFGIVRLIWNRWTRAEQQMVLAHRGVNSAGYWRLVGLGFVVWSMIEFARLAVTDEFAMLDEGDSLGKIVLQILAFALVSALLVLLRPGPPVPSPGHHQRAERAQRAWLLYRRRERFLGSNSSRPNRLPAGPRTGCHRCPERGDPTRVGIDLTSSHSEGRIERLIFQT